jgi:hypothetical protein
MSFVFWWLIGTLMYLGIFAGVGALRRRFPWLRVPKSLSVKRLLAGKEAPDWIVILSGATLPQGGPFWVQVQLKSESGSGIIDAKSTPHRVCNQSVPEDWCRSVLAMLKDLTEEDFRAIPSDVGRVFDGLPCTVYVIRKSPPSVWEASCNLVAPGQSQRPLVVIAKALLKQITATQGRELPKYGAGASLSPTDEQVAAGRLSTRGGFCFVATACFGDYDHPTVVGLRGSLSGGKRWAIDTRRFMMHALASRRIQTVAAPPTPRPRPENGSVRIRRSIGTVRRPAPLSWITDPGVEGRF